MRIGIIGAMDIEVAHLKSKMTDVEIKVKAGREYHAGKFSGKDIVVVQCGIGKVNAAVCTQILIDEFQVDAIINTGVAGSLKSELNIGDIVVSKDALYHDMDATNFGYQKGQIPQMDTWRFLADQGLILLAVKACRAANPDIGVSTGTVASGDQFICDDQVKEAIKENFDPSCVEMEGAAIAHTAWLNQVPFVILRAISDKADGSATMDYPEFEKKAAKDCVRLVEKMLEEL